MKIRRGDAVVVLSGKDKGKHGKISRVLPRENKVVIDGVNVKKKHERPKRQNQKGQIVERPAPIHASNVALLDPKTGAPTRAGYRITGGKKERVLKKSGAVI